MKLADNRSAKEALYFHGNNRTFFFGGNEFFRACRGTEVPGYGYEGRLRGLDSLRRQASQLQSRGRSSPGCTTRMGLL